MKKALFMAAFLQLATSRIAGQSNSPEIFSAAGNRFDNQNISMEWTVGEPVTFTLESSNIQLTQGFHQPRDGIIDHLESVVFELGEIKVFPNPSKGIVNAELQLNNRTQLEFIITANNGTVLTRSTQVVRNETIAFDLSKYPDGTYILQIKSSDGLNKTSFIIQKINIQ